MISFWVFAGLVAIAVGRAIHRRRARTVVSKWLARFNHQPGLGTYHESRPRIGWGKIRVPHAVLLLHGYSASPAAFDPLLPALQSAGFVYYAPLLTGFGLDRMTHLEAATASDWRRDVEHAYGCLAAVADEVSVVGISFGTLLAADLAARHPVKHLVLLAPYFYATQGEQRLRRWARHSVLGWIGKLLGVYLYKPQRADRPTPLDILSREEAERFFQYPALPLASLVELWRFPTAFNFPQLRYESLVIGYGEQENTSDVPHFLQDLEQQGVSATVQCFANTAHNPFHDGDKAAVVAMVMQALRKHEAESIH